MVSAAQTDKQVNEDTLWKKFFIFQSSEESNSKWISFLTKLCLDPDPLFYQHITQELFETIISKKLAIKHVTSMQSSTGLTLEEENVVRYIAISEGM